VSEAELRAYYEARAPYYDEAYAGETPAWVHDMVAAMRATLAGRHVLELACGTGVWTERLAPVAASIRAVDTSPAMRGIAARRLSGYQSVRVSDGDAYRLADIDGDFDGGLAMQWFSHVPAARRAEFLAGWHARLRPGARVFLGDNVGESALRLSGTADTYEPRTLPNGDEYLIVKNYFTKAELRAIFEPAVGDLRVTLGTRWWWLGYRLS